MLTFLENNKTYTFSELNQSRTELGKIELVTSLINSALVGSSTGWFNIYIFSEYKKVEKSSQKICAID